MAGISEERILAEAPAAGKLAQAYLISAGSQTEAEQAAERFLRRIFCEEKRGCGRCGGCVKFDGGSHVDLFRIEGETSINKNQLENLDEFLSKRSYEGGYRCVYIKGAHKMNSTVQNKLLKSIEEPPENVVFVLATNEPEKLLTTTRSRCVAVKIRPRSREEIFRLLEGAAPEEIVRMAAAQSMGSLAEAEALLSDEAFDKSRKSAAAILGMLCQVRNPSVFKMQEMLAEDFAGVSYQMALLLRDGIYQSLTAGGDCLMNPDEQQQIVEMTERFTSAGMSLMLEAVLEAYEKKKNCQGLNAKLLAETLLFRLVEVRNRCLK